MQQWWFFVNTREDITAVQLGAQNYFDAISLAFLEKIVSSAIVALPCSLTWWTDCSLPLNVQANTILEDGPITSNEAMNMAKTVRTIFSIIFTFLNDSISTPPTCHHCVLAG
jgi:hypothetical protein